MLEINRAFQSSPLAFSGSLSISESIQRLASYQRLQERVREWTEDDSSLPSEVYPFYQERDTSTTFVSPLYIELIKQKYSIPGDGEVLHFLEVYPFLAQLLIEAYPYIRKYFSQAKASIEVVADPEEYGREQLVAFIKTDREPEDAVEALSNFDKAWWLAALKRAQGNLCITVEY